MAGMKFQMAKNSLFAILLRSPWWVSIGVAVVLFGALKLMIPLVYAAFSTLPFLAIGGYVGWKQLLAPSAAQAEKVMQRLRGMSWDEFSATLEAAFRRDGFIVNRLAGEDADFELLKGSHRSLVSCKRWKAARAGAEPLRQLAAARRKWDAHECLYIATGEVSDNARALAAEKGIRVVEGTELAQLVARR
jgi:restriction system protein